MNATDTIRIAGSSDIDQLADLFNQYRQFYECPPDLSASKTGLRKILSGTLNDPRRRGWPSTNWLHTAVSRALLVDLVEYFVLYDLFVAPSARRQGIARALMNAASKWAKAQGAARLDLETARDNFPGQALYRIGLRTR